MQSGRRESLEGITDEAFCRILPSTKVTFLANKYKFVFVLDLSPSAVAVVSTLIMFFVMELKTMESLENGLQLHSGATPLFSMTTELQASSLHCHSVDANA